MSVYEQLSKFDSPTIFNAVDKYINESNIYSRDTHSLMYTDKTIKCLLPTLGNIVGRVITAEVTTNDPDSKAIPWDEYYSTLENSDGPTIAAAPFGLITVPAVTMTSPKHFDKPVPL